LERDVRETGTLIHGKKSWLVEVLFTRPEGCNKFLNLVFCEDAAAKVLRFVLLKEAKTAFNCWSALVNCTVFRGAIKHSFFCLRRLLPRRIERSGQRNNAKAALNQRRLTVNLSRRGSGLLIANQGK
jgi:hypothetical protein